MAACGSSSAQRPTKSEMSMLFSCGFGRVCTKARTSRTFFASTVSASLLKVAYVRRLPECPRAALILKMMLSLEVATAVGESGAMLTSRDRTAGEFAGFDVAVSVELRFSMRDEEIFAGATV